jgi:uncharacterized protein (DUF342 family)
MKTVLDEKLCHIRLLAEVSADQLEFFLTLEPTEEGEKCRLDQSAIKLILNPVIEMERLNISLLQNLIDLANKGAQIKAKRLARGTDPQDGENGSLEWVVKSVEGFDPMSRNLTCFRDLQCVLPGTLITRVIPPTAGAPGEDVFGNVLHAKSGLPVKPNISRSFVVVPSAEENGIEYVRSLEPGFIYDDRGQLKVSQQLCLNGDVDLGTGDISFVGELEVKGDIAKGFSVSALKGLTVSGRTHGGGSLSSAAGSVIVHDFVSGLDSHLKTYGAIHMPEGHFLGKEAQSLLGIEASIFGSDSRASVVIKGFSLEEVQALLNSAMAHQKKVQATLEILQQKVTPLLQEGVKLPALKKSQITSMNELLLEKSRLESLYEVLTQRLERLTQVKEHPVFQVNYLNTLHKGVVIQVGEETFTPTETLQGPGTILYSPDTRKFSAVALKPLKTIS